MKRYDWLDSGLPAPNQHGCLYDTKTGAVVAEAVQCGMLTVVTFGGIHPLHVYGCTPEVSPKYTTYICAKRAIETYGAWLSDEQDERDNAAVNVEGRP